MFPHLFAMKWWDQMPWSSFSECFKPTFSLSSFTFIKRLFSSSSLSAIRVVSSVYLRLLMFLLAILIPACASSSPAFLMMYSAAVAAKSLQSCLTLCDPIDGSPLGSPVPGILQARTLEGVAISFSNAWKWKWSRSVVSDPQRPHGLQPTRLLHPWGFSRQEYWSGVPLPNYCLKIYVFQMLLQIDFERS